MATLDADDRSPPGGRGIRRRFDVAVASITALLICFAGTARAAPSLEYQVKASYIYNLTQFIEWPEHAPGDEFQICVYGPHRFGDALDTLEGNRVGDRPLRVRYLRDMRVADSCQILFITASEGRRALQLLRAAPVTGLLTIGETRDFTDRGGVIGLIKIGGKVKFEINEAAAERAGLAISAQLLRLATEVVER